MKTEHRAEIEDPILRAALSYPGVEVEDTGLSSMEDRFAAMVDELIHSPAEFRRYCDILLPIQRLEAVRLAAQRGDTSHLALLQVVPLPARSE